MTRNERRRADRLHAAVAAMSHKLYVATDNKSRDWAGFYWRNALKAARKVSAICHRCAVDACMNRCTFTKKHKYAWDMARNASSYIQERMSELGIKERP